MKLRYDAVTALKEALGDTSAGNLSIFRVITQWTMNPTVNPMLPSSVPGFQVAIDSAAQSQSDIGLPNLFRGLISESWGNSTDNVPSSNPREDRSSQVINHLAGTIRVLQN